MKEVSEVYDVVVCGGGLAGFSAAVSAARHGAKTCILQDRPVFGGNSSSEVRVTVHGSAAFHAYARETGIISELLIEERARNHEEINENGWVNNVWDMTLYDMARSTPNLTYHLNCSVRDVIMSDGTRGSEAYDTFLGKPEHGYYHREALNQGAKIQSIEALILDSETLLKIEGEFFIDCTGDASVAHLAGSEWRMGSEGRDEFNEPHAPEKPSTDTMGNSIHIRARDMGRPVPYVAPDWAVKHEDPAFFYEQGRNPGDPHCGFWWIEIGVPWHTIYDNEDIREELTRHALGVWDWMKNHDPVMREKAANYALDTVTQVLGKRESRRVIGKHILTEHDPLNKTVFEDEIAFGGWFIDLHTPGGLLAATSEPASAEGYKKNSDYAIKSYCGPYGIPLSCCVSKDVGNLMMAGRNVSATRAALGTARVMGTTALMGQGCGTAAAQMVAGGIDLDTYLSDADSVKSLKQALLRDGVFLPNSRHEDQADLAKTATISASSEALLYGVSPQSKSDQTGIEKYIPHAREEQIDNGVLDSIKGQFIATQGGVVESVSIFISNTSNQVQDVKAQISVAEHIWDYAVNTGRKLKETILSIEPGAYQRVTWPVSLSTADGLPDRGWLRLDLFKNESLIWEVVPHAIVPGHTGVFGMNDERMRRLSRGLCLSFEIEPPQSVFRATEAVSGESRPYHFTNLWRSDPSRALPQSLILSWDHPVMINEVILTFPGHLLYEYHGYGTFYRDAQCVKDYQVQMKTGDGWKTIHHVKGNYQRLNRIKLDTPVDTTELRVLCESTWGDPSAAIYEIRVY